MKTLPPHVDLLRQKAGTRILLETTIGIWDFKLNNPAGLLIEVTSTDPRFCHRTKPCLGQFIESTEPKSGPPLFEKGKLIKGWMFSIRFADVILIAEPVQSINISGDGWSYEIAS